MKLTQCRLCLQKPVGNLLRFVFYPRPPCSELFHAIFDSWPLYQDKNEYRKTPFLVTKSQKSYPNIRYVFLISDPQVVGGFIAIFWLMAILWSKKLKSAKYRFWLQKGVKNWIRQDFLIRDPQLVGSFICYFCLKMTRTLTFFGGGESCGFSPPQAVWNL